MAIPYIPSGAWAFGTLEEQNLGGIFAAIFADSIVPWSKPSDWATHPEMIPTWWDPPIPAYDRGEFEGWERNMAFEGGAPNFPPDRRMNVALPLMRGFCNSEHAPFRLTYSGDLDWRWPHGNTNGTTEFPTASEIMLFYIDNYLEPGTRFIAPIPERDIMNYLGADSASPINDPLLGVGPPAIPTAIPEEGEAAIRQFVANVLTKLDELGLDTLVGWYSVDEPDLTSRKIWAFPEELARVRLLIRDAEKQARIELDPTGFGLMDPIEQEKRLRPVIVTLSSAFDDRNDQGVLENPDVQPRLYATAVAADMYFFDFYGFRRSLQDINPELDECPAVRAKLSGYYIPNDPPRSIRMFRELKRQVNGTLTPGTPGYIPVVNWQQSAGAPYRDAEATPSSATEAGDPPSELISLEECTTGDLTYQRVKGMADDFGFRYLGIGSILEGGEALPFFNQPGIADDLVLSRIDPVLREIGFFHLLRSRSQNRNSELRSTYLRRPDRPSSPRNPLFPPVPPPPPVPAPPLGIPELQLTHLQPFVLFCDFTPLFLPTIFEGPAKTWLFLINHTSVTLGPGHLPLLFPTIPAAIGGVPQYAWEEMAWRDGTLRPVLDIFGQPVRLYIDGYHRAQQLILARWRVRIFRLTGV